MRQVESYECEYCKKRFDIFIDCLNHEKAEHTEKHIKCSKCGKEEIYRNDEQDFPYHNFNIGRVGYGSSLDGCDIEFTLCDECLCEMVKSFTKEGQEHIYNSGGNYYCEDDE